MFKKANWQTDEIFRVLSRISLRQAHFVLLIAVFGGVMFIGGLSTAGPTLEASTNKVPLPLLMMLVGGAVCFGFLPIPYIVYLAMELQKVKTKVEQFEKGKK